MKEFESCESGMLPLRRARPEIKDSSVRADPLPLRPEDREEISGFLGFIQRKLDEFGVVVDNEKRLVGYGGFSFKAVTTSTGSTVPKTELSIWYHPKRTEPMPGHQSISVLDAVYDGTMYYGQGWEKGKEFHLFKNWREALTALAEDCEEADADFRKRRKLQAARTALPVNHPEVEARRINEGLDFKRNLTLVQTTVEKTAEARSA